MEVFFNHRLTGVPMYALTIVAKGYNAVRNAASATPDMIRITNESIRNASLLSTHWRRPKAAFDIPQMKSPPRQRL